MNAQDLKNSILQLAVQGKLVEQRAEEGTARELLEQIKLEKDQLIKDKKISEVLDAFRGVRCGAKPTSCPDQIAEALSEYARKLG